MLFIHWYPRRRALCERLWFFSLIINIHDLNINKFSIEQEYLTKEIIWKYAVIVQENILNDKYILKQCF